MNVLVTGSSGFVGRHVVDYLSAHGHNPITVDLSEADQVGSVTDAEFVLGALSKLDFDAIVHLAAVTDLRKTIEDPYTCYQVNCFGTLNMLELGSRKKVKRFVLPSSANVYGAPRKNPVDETAEFRPRVPYDYSKVVAEQMAMGYYTSKGLPVSITRAWLLFGERDLPTRAVPRFITACIKNEPIQLYNSGRDTTAPSHASNYAKLVARLLESDSAIGEAFNFGGERVVTIRELAELIKERLDSKSELVMLPPRSEAEKEPQVSFPSTEKIRRVLGYTYETSLEGGIDKTIDFVGRMLALRS